MEEGGARDNLSFLCDTANALSHNAAAMAGSLEESVTALHAFLNAVLLFVEGKQPDHKKTPIDVHLEQLLEAVKVCTDMVKLFQGENQRLTAKGPDAAREEIAKHYNGRFQYLGPKIKGLLATQQAFFGSVSVEVGDVSEKLSDKLNGGGYKAKPPVPAPRSRTATAERIKPPPLVDLPPSKGRSMLETSPRQAMGPPPVPFRTSGSQSYDDMSNLIAERRRRMEQRNAEDGGPKRKGTIIPTPSAPRPDGEAPPPSRPSSTQVDFVPAQNMSASQTLLATASLLGSPPGSAAVLVNYHNPAAPASPPASHQGRALPTPPTNATGSPKPSSPNAPPRNGRKDHNSYDLGSRSPDFKNEHVLDNGSSSLGAKRGRLIPPVIENPEWAGLPRQVKGNTGVDPVLVQGRRAYWEENQEKIVGALPRALGNT